MYRYLKIAGIIISFFCIIQMNLFQTQFWIIPFVYTILICWYSNTNPGKGAGHIAIMVAMAGRYLLTPLSIYGTGQLSSFARQYSYLNEATILIIYEMVTVFITLWLLDKKYKRKIDEYHRIDPINRFPVINFSVGNMFFFLAVSAWLFIAFFYKNLVGGFSVLISGALNEMREVEQVEYNASNIIGGIIWQTLCIWLYTYIVVKQRNKLENTASNRPVIVAIVLTAFTIILSFIDQAGLSRWFTIVMTGATVSCLIRLFPDKRKTIVATVITPAALLVLFITLFKNVGLILGEGTVKDAFFDLFDPSKMDIYFAGPVNVNNAYYLVKNYDLNVFTIFNDICNNMPIVNHYMDTRATSVYAYNESLGRIYENNAGDQIIPLIGQSMIYFSEILAPVLSCISVWVACWADYKFSKCKNFMFFAYAFIAVWFGVESMMLNLTITCSWIYNRIIPFVIALSITNKAAGIYKS